jgi:hypothetical protein
VGNAPKPPGAKLADALTVSSPRATPHAGCGKPNLLGNPARKADCRGFASTGPIGQSLRPAKSAARLRTAPADYPLHPP